jgi:cytochrome P450
MELSAAPLLILSIVSLAILVSLLSRQKSAPSSKNRQPPGPRSLPFIGSLLHLLTSAPQVALRDLSRKHGPVMYLRLGQIDTVVISSPALAQEVLRDSTLTFMSRPRILAAEIIAYGNTDIIFAPYGAYWRTLRKLCTVELLSTRKVRQFGAIRDRETMSLVRDVGAASGGGEPVNLATLLLSCTNAITARATFGEVCDDELREQFLSAMEVAVTLGAGFCFGDLFPSLRFVDVATGLTRRLWRVRRQLDAVFDRIIAECEARREEKKKTAEQTGDDDLLSVILRIKDEGDLEFPIGTTNIKAIILVSVVDAWISKYNMSG